MSLFGKMRDRLAKAGAQRPPGRTIAPGAMQGVPLNQPMNLIQVPDLSRKLVTRYGLREKSPTPTLAAEVVPVVLVDDLVGESDLIRPRIRPCAGSLQQATVAQQFLGGLMNPAGSRVIIHLYYLWISGTATVQYDIHFTGTPGVGVTGSMGFRNGLLPAQAPAGQMVGHITGISPGGVVEGRIRAGGATMALLPFDAVLDEGQGVQIRGAASTTTAEINMAWSEEDKQ